MDGLVVLKEETVATSGEGEVYQSSFVVEDYQEEVGSGSGGRADGVAEELAVAQEVFIDQTVTYEVRDIDCEVPVLSYSGQQLQVVAEQDGEEGASFFLPKPDNRVAKGRYRNIDGTNKCYVKQCSCSCSCSRSTHTRDCWTVYSVPTAIDANICSLGCDEEKARPASEVPNFRDRAGREEVVQLHRV